MVAAGVFGATIISTLYVAGMASATTPIKPSDLEGRWKSEASSSTRARQLTFDILPCGTGWCGIEVKPNGTCGRIALRLSQMQKSEAIDDTIAFEGRVELEASTRAYVVRADLFHDQGVLRLSIVGNTGIGTLALATRSFAFEQLMARAGETTCRVDPKIS